MLSSPVVMAAAPPPLSSDVATRKTSGDGFHTPSALGWFGRAPATAGPSRSVTPLVQELLHDLKTVEEVIVVLRRDLAAAEHERARLHHRLVVAADQLLTERSLVESSAPGLEGPGEADVVDPLERAASPVRPEVEPITLTTPVAHSEEAVPDEPAPIAVDDVDGTDQLTVALDDEDTLEGDLGDVAGLAPRSDAESRLQPQRTSGTAPFDLSGLIDGEARLLILSGAEDTNALRRQLPDGWALQPDGDLLDVSTALVYRPTQPVTGHDGMLGRAYACVDALALLDSSGLLDPDLHAALLHRIPDLSEVRPSYWEHLEARAHWRRSEPVTSEAVRPYVARGGSRGSRHLAAWLTTLVAQDSPYFDAMTVLTGALRGDPPPDLPLTPEPALSVGVVDEPAASGPFDFSRIAAKRLNAERARAALEGLAPEDEDLPTDAGGHSAVSELTAMLDAATTALFLQLVTAGVHSVDVVRTWARDLDLVPLSALRRINDWAERRMEDRGTPLDAPLIEVDDPNRAVWVDDSAKELLS